MRFDIEPKIGLGNFILGMYINQVLTFIKRYGNYFKNNFLSKRKIILYEKNYLNKLFIKFNNKIKINN